MPHDIVHELEIAAPASEVYEAVTTQQGLAGWWTRDATEALAVGAEARFGFDGGAVRFTMRVDALEAPELVHWQCTAGPDEWVGTSIAFRIEGTDAGSTLRFWHGGWEYEDGDLPRASFRWAMYLDSLRRLLETGTGSPADG
ncbi:MAG: SRPBCC domain-containing protein [Acidimicrobiales bacterium]|jgi:uncharacterized protein YndB with AHSA1/START domain|nr:SRPBCC domain-containing protein [Acidimicrobiales bacterium]